MVVCMSNNFHGRAKIGSREVVGFGINGEYVYVDRIDFPCPAIRFKEVKGGLVQLKEKEKGDWKNLSIDEKKTRKLNESATFKYGQLINCSSFVSVPGKFHANICRMSSTHR